MKKDKIQLAADGKQPQYRAWRICARIMRQMLDYGWKKDDLPELERIFWTVRDSRGEVYRNPELIN